eukprot:TRINITY_DN7661_c0_g2_i1.p1 TRINITY_DN7661_c0_g2~~TRINITY_DN7661_c0_g2_i1.p1  ORF type:complete len:674 (+),score=174.27 TRINITY_DN7661_c0_g2_i1:76-2097(+)
MKKLIKAAALDKADPTPGYVYRDFSQFTFSDMNNSKKLAESLVEKLESFKTPLQMTKTLKVIKHCATNGHPDFQKTMQKHSDQMRAFANYRGARDPVHEDRLNQQVRDAGREVMDAIFSEQASSKVVNSLEGHGANTRDEKMHDSSFRDTDSSFKPKSNKLQDAIDARNKKPEGVFSGLKSAVAKLGISQGNNHTNLMSQMEEQNKGAGYVGNFGNSAPPASAGSPQSSSSPTWGFKGEQDSPGASLVVKDADVLTSMQQVIQTYSSKSSAPGRGDISKFMKEIAVIEEEEGDELAPRLDEKLGQKIGWQVRLNVLTLIEALVKANNTEVVEYFTENPEDIQKNVNVVQTTVKEKAKKVLLALKVPEVVATKRTIVVPGVMAVHADPVVANDEEVVSASTAPAPRKKKSEGTKLKKRGKKLNSAVPTGAPLQMEPNVAVQSDGDLFAMLSTAAAPIAPTPMATPVAPTPMPSQGIPTASLGNAALDDLFASPSASVSAASGTRAPSVPVASGSGLDTLFPSEVNPAPTPHATPLTKVPQGGFDFAAFSAASGANSPTQQVHLPPTPVQSPVSGLAPSSSVGAPPIFAGLGEPVPQAAVPVVGNDMMAQLQAQQAALQAQINALQRAQTAQTSMPLPTPTQNMPPLPQATTAQQNNVNSQFAFIGQEMAGAMNK